MLLFASMIAVFLTVPIVIIRSVHLLSQDKYIDRVDMFMEIISFFTVISWVIVFAEIRSISMNIVIFIFSYLFIGALWALVQWTLYVLGRAKIYHEMKAAWLEEQMLPLIGKLSEEQRKEFHSKIVSVQPFSTRPKAKENKGRIFFWMIWWPIGVVWAFIKYPVSHSARMLKAIFNTLPEVFDKISKHAYKGIDED